MAQAIPRTDDQISAEISALASLSTPQLRERWKVVYEIEPPPRTSRDFLMRAVAYRIQEDALGGLSASTRRLLERIADDAAARRVMRVTPIRKLHPGAILLREWGSIQHQVTILEKGVLFRGKQYRSLSEVARVITGSRWSGPLFFGLKTRSKETASDGDR
jgi:Protein of unknown function (DUF2924)